MTAVAMSRRRVEQVMGTVVSLDLRDDAVPEEAVDQALAWLHDVDRRFSMWKDDSEVRRLARGEVTESAVSADVREVLRLCEDVRGASSGVFDIRRWRSDGLMDPTGLVKGWSVERAALILDAAGAQRYSFNTGGDAVVRGEPEPGRAWRVGIQHPLLRDKVAAVVAISDLAVATSGAYERGQHIVDARNGRPPSDVLSVTVIGDSLTLADAYATAAFAMGREGLRWVAGIPGYSACAITTTERLLWTPGFDRHMASLGDEPR
jgi:thiamine biosynthesis lipoprotein